MGWVYNAVFSSLGKKYIMALSGIFLLIYLVIHLFGNSFLYVGRDAFNLYVHTLTESSLHYVILVIEVVLFLGFLIHIVDGVKLTLENWKARPGRYAVKPEDPQANVASRTMWLSASIVFIFLVIHLKNFWYVYKFGGMTEGVTMYDMVVEVFRDPVYSAIYLFAMFLLGFHLWHGFQSSFQSLGLHHRKYTPLIMTLGKIYTIIIAGGFATFPVYFYFGGK